MKLSPEKAAIELLVNGCSIQDYEELQTRRKERIEVFKQHKVKVLIEESTALYEYGEKVLAEMKKLMEGKNPLR